MPPREQQNSSGASILRPQGSEAQNDPEPLARMEECLMRQFALCEALEALADSLPSRVDTRAAALLVDQLRPTLRRCHRLEETLVFPVLLISGPQITPILDRLREEHLEDEDQASDLHDAVTAFVGYPTGAGAGEVGYMLRCLFVSLRRHLAFDRDYVLPLYRRTCGY